MDTKQPVVPFNQPERENGGELCPEQEFSLLDPTQPRTIFTFYPIHTTPELFIQAITQLAKHPAKDHFAANSEGVWTEVSVETRQPAAPTRWILIKIHYPPVPGIASTAELIVVEFQQLAPARLKAAIGTLTQDNRELVKDYVVWIAGEIRRLYPECEIEPRIASAPTKAPAGLQEPSGSMDEDTVYSAEEEIAGISTDAQADEAWQEADRPDLGGTTWSPERLLQEFRERFGETLASAIARNIIPNIWDMEEVQRQYFFAGLQQVLTEGLRYAGLRPYTRDESKEFTDQELQTAWQYAQQAYEQTLEKEADRYLHQLVQAGFLPDERTTDPELFNRFMEETRKEPVPSDPMEAVMRCREIWGRVQAEWKHDREVAQVQAALAEQQKPLARVVPKEKRGMKVGTAERVQEMHRLLKKGLSLRQAKRQAHCDVDTYRHYCKQETGEEPINPYR